MWNKPQGANVHREICNVYKKTLSVKLFTIPHVISFWRICLNLDIQTIGFLKMFINVLFDPHGCQLLFVNVQSSMILWIQNHAEAKHLLTISLCWEHRLSFPEICFTKKSHHNTWFLLCIAAQFSKDNSRPRVQNVRQIPPHTNTKWSSQWNRAVLYNRTKNV